MLNIAVRFRRAYIANLNSNNFKICQVDINGSLSNCTDIGSFSEPTSSITFNTDSTRAYVSTSNNVSFCQVDVNGGLSGCTTTGNGFSAPAGITLNTVNTRAYVVNLNSTRVSHLRKLR